MIYHLRTTSRLLDMLMHREETNLDQANVEKVSLRLTCFGILFAATGGAIAFLTPYFSIGWSLGLLGTTSTGAGILFWRLFSSKQSLTPPKDFLGIALALAICALLLFAISGYLFAFSDSPYPLLIFMIAIGCAASSVMAILANTNYARKWLERANQIDR